jgi:hypothetical protein
VKEMLKEVREVKVGGRMQRVQVRPFAWNARMLLTLPAFVGLFTLFAGCERGAATDTSPQVAEGSGVWRELAPGIRYQEEEGRVSLDIKPPLLTEESVQKFAEYAQKKTAQSTPEERAFWEENLQFVKEQYAFWSDEELVVSALEHAISNRFPLPQEEAQRQELRAKLREVVRQMKRHGPDNLPPDDYWQNLLPELKTP